MPNKHLATALGALTGLVMPGRNGSACLWGLHRGDVDVRLGGDSPGHAALDRVRGMARAPRSSQPAGALAVLLVNLVGCGVVWLSVLGPVIALSCSLAAFVVIWVSDWPARRPMTEERFVRIEELHRADDS